MVLKDKKKRIKLKEPPLPHPFPLPVNYAQCVTDGIAKGQMTGRARTKFIATVASSIFGVKREPSKEELRSVAAQITHQYPSVGASSKNMVSYSYLGTIIIMYTVKIS